MKKRIVLEMALICIFGFTGWYLFGVMKQTESDNPELKEIESNNSLVFSYGTGIDVTGNKIDSYITNSMDDVVINIVAFFLRYDSLDADLMFWNEVGSYLAELDTVKLIAYCESVLCIEAVKRNPDIAHFTVLEYGNVIDMQAIVNADMAGEFWLRGTKRVKWRDGAKTPFDVSQNIRLGQ